MKINLSFILLSILAIGMLSTTIITITTTIGNHISYAQKDNSNSQQQQLDPELLKLMPKDTLNGIADQSKKDISACTPFSQHKNDNATLIAKTGASDTCYNLMARATKYCDDGMITDSAVCSDPQLMDFKNNYYDPVNRPFNDSEVLNSMTSHAPK